MSARIITLTGTPHPTAEVQRLDPATGRLVFRWLDAQGQPVDSGGSVASFTPPEPLSEDPEQPGVVLYPEVADETLAAAVAAALVDPPAPVPTEVTPWQMRRALNAAGLRATVEAAVAAADQDTRDGWEFASAIRRDNALINSMAAGLGLTSAQVDDLFRSAATFK